jgi:hypothetical protein
VRGGGGTGASEEGRGGGGGRGRGECRAAVRIGVQGVHGVPACTVRRACTVCVLVHAPAKSPAKICDFANCKWNARPHLIPRAWLMGGHASESAWMTQAGMCFNAATGRACALHVVHARSLLQKSLQPNRILPYNTGSPSYLHARSSMG